MMYLYLALAFVFNAAANVLLKIGATSGFSFSGFLRGEWTLAHLYAGTAAALFAGNLLFYLLALRDIPLSVAYPIMVGMTFLITIGASLVLGENIRILHAFGIALIITGIVLVVRFAQA